MHSFACIYHIKIMQMNGKSISLRCNIWRRCGSTFHIYAKIISNLFKFKREFYAHAHTNTHIINHITNPVNFKDLFNPREPFGKTSFSFLLLLFTLFTPFCRAEQEKKECCMSISTVYVRGRERW